MLLSSNPLDWPTLAAAYALPPLLYFLGRDWVVGPLQRSAAARRCRWGWFAMQTFGAMT